MSTANQPSQEAEDISLNDQQTSLTNNLQNIKRQKVYIIASEPNQTYQRQRNDNETNQTICIKICIIMISVLIFVTVARYMAMSGKVHMKQAVTKTIDKANVIVANNSKNQIANNQQHTKVAITQSVSGSPPQQFSMLISTPIQSSTSTNLLNPYYDDEIPSNLIDKYNFKVDIDQMLQLSSPEKFYNKDNLREDMHDQGFQQLVLALRLLFVVHNVGYDGLLKIEHVQDNTIIEDKEKQDKLATKEKQLKEVLDMEHLYYDKKYQLQKYMTNQLPFCIVVPSYNNVKSRLYLRNLDSLFMQNYQNYHIVYIDDASPDKTGQFVQSYIKQKKIPSQKIKIIINKKNVLALENIYNAIHQECRAGDIVALVDGDDSLIGRQVLALYNAVYRKNQAAFVYSNYLHVMFNKEAAIGGSSRAIPIEYLKNGNIRKQKVFVTSHLLTFYADLFRMIKRQDLTYSNGTFFRYAYDVAMCCPMIQMATTKVTYIAQLLYEYRYDTGQNDPGNGQVEVTDIVFAKKPYNQLKDFPFIDNRQEYLKTAKVHTVKEEKFQIQIVH